MFFFFFLLRHGIDLDNPGPGGPSSLLLALETQSSAAFVQNLSSSQTPAPTHSDSGESLRSTDNATPPMHFLTPHVEISMTENGELFNVCVVPFFFNIPIINCLLLFMFRIIKLNRVWRRLLKEK